MDFSFQKLVEKLYPNPLVFSWIRIKKIIRYLTIRIRMPGCKDTWPIIINNSGKDTWPIIAFSKYGKSYITVWNKPGQSSFQWSINHLSCLFLSGHDAGAWPGKRGQLPDVHEGGRVHRHPPLYTLRRHLERQWPESRFGNCSPHQVDYSWVNGVPLLMSCPSWAR